MPVINHCGSGLPGHHINELEARMAAGPEAAGRPVQLVRRVGTRFDVVVGDDCEVWYFHDHAATLRNLAGWTPETRAELMATGTLRLDGRSVLHPCRDLALWSECRPDPRAAGDGVHPILRRLRDRDAGTGEKVRGTVVEWCGYDQDLLVDLIGDVARLEAAAYVDEREARANDDPAASDHEAEKEAWRRVDQHLRLAVAYVMELFA